jgi:two-component system, OmpR family, sensor histidine kinase KdpD
LNLAKRSSPVDEIVAIAAQRAENLLGGRKMEIDMPAEPPNVYADASSIAEVLFTLIDNAAKYSTDGTRIRVATQRTGDSVKISVEDQGKGIPKEMRGKIFDKFVRLEETDIHQTGSGLGLGLAIAKGMVESQGGSIDVADGGDGFETKFTLTLPAADEIERSGA